MMSRAQNLLWAAGSLLCLAALYDCVSPGFDRARIPLVASAGSSGAIVTFLPATGWTVPDGLLVLSARVENIGSAPETIEVRGSTESVQRLTVQPGRRGSVRTAWRQLGSTPPMKGLVLSGPPGGWRVDSAEIANVYGFSRGLLNFFVLPAAQQVPRTPAWALILLAIAAGAAARSQKAIVEGLAGAILTMVAAVSATFIAAAVVSSHISAFRILLAPRTFVLCVALMAGRRVVHVVEKVVLWFAEADLARRPLAVFACGLVSAAFATSAMIQTLAHYDGNYSGFLHLSREVAARAPFLRERPDLARTLVTYEFGYDGQFMYLMAFDPWLSQFKSRPERYRDVTDTPPYRYGRIAFSALTRVVAGNRPERFPMVMMWLIVAAHFILGASLASVAVRHRIAPGFALLYLAIPAFMASLVFALPEALAAAALALGFACLEWNRPWTATICLAAAPLVRETTAILVMALVATRLQTIGWRRCVLLMGTALVPVVAWRSFVGWRLMPDFGWSAFLFNPGLFEIPFSGLVHLMHAAFTRVQAPPEIHAAIVYPCILVAAFWLALRLAYRRPEPLALAACAYGLMAVSLKYDKVWAHLPSGERGTFELFLCLLLLLLIAPAEARLTRRTIGALFCALAVYTIGISPEADVSRAALLLIR